MFVIRCCKCGREQVWTADVVLGSSEIEVADKSVFCTCGNAVIEENGRLVDKGVDASRPV